MPEEMPAPRTIQEVGIHLVYMAKAQNDTNASLVEMKQTLKEIKNDSVTRADFDEHVIWGKDAIKSLDDRMNTIDTRVKTVEDWRALENGSIWEAIKKQLFKYLIAAIAVAIGVGVLYFIVKTTNIDITSLTS